MLTATIPNRVDYTVALIFSEDRRLMLLVEKRRPLWQVGRYNGVGGKIEPGETASDCVYREVMEETGLDLPDLKLFARVSDWDATRWRVYYYVGYCPSPVIASAPVKSKDLGNDEPLVIIANPLDYIANREKLTGNPLGKLISNLQWLIPMAIGRDVDSDTVYDIREHWDAAELGAFEPTHNPLDPDPVELSRLEAEGGSCGD